MVIIIIAIIGLIVLSAFFSSCENAYSSVSRIKLKNAADEGNKNAMKAINIIDNYSTTLSTILIGNNLVNILISSLGTIVAIDLLGEEIGPLMATIVLTIVLLIFGEILPKTLGNKFNYSLSLFYPKIYNFFKFIFYPITFVVNKMIAGTVGRMAPKENTPTATDEELITITEELEEEGVIDEDDAVLIKSAIDFCDVTAHEIMIPRVDVFAIDIEDTLNEIIQEEELFKYSRVPVYEDTIDNIIGILNTTELMKLKLSNKNVDIRSMLEEPYYVHKTKYISTILSEMKSSRNKLALVMDEFGGVMGIVTIEDIVEELIGDVFDELDEEVLDYHQIDENLYEVDGDMNIYDFFELVEYDDREFESEYTTIGGWCTDVLQKFPEPGETFNFANLTLTIKSVDKMRVEIVTVEVHTIIEDDE